MFRRLPLQLLRNFRQKGGDSWPGGSFWSEGTSTGRNGYLFGERPPPEGHSRKWESWEFMTYTAYGTAFLMGYFIVNGPDNSLQAWAHPRALKELEDEDALFAAYAADPEAQAASAEKLAALNKHPDRYYDAIMMRNEYEVLKGKKEAAA